MSKYSPEISDKIVKLISAGNFASIAFQAAGISHDTFHRWIKEKPEFSESIKKAKAERVASLILAIRQDTSWQSKAWMLERLDREKYHLLTASEAEMRAEIAEIRSMVQDLKEKNVTS